MQYFAGLDISQEKTSICIVDAEGRIIAERKVATCPEAIADVLTKFSVTRAGLETGPLSVWLWNELKAAGVPIICMDARHANAALSMMPAKTDRNDAVGLAQIVRTGWCKIVHVKSAPSHEARALLAARSHSSRFAVAWKMKSEASCAPSASCSGSALEASPDARKRSLQVSWISRPRSALWSTRL